MEEPDDEEPDDDDPDDDDVEGLAFSAGFAAGVDSDLAGLFSAESEFDFLPDSARESLR